MEPVSFGWLVAGFPRLWLTCNVGVDEYHFAS